MNNTPSKRILVRFEKATKNGGYNDYYTLATDEDISVGFEAKIVDELPEVGDTKYIYLVPSDESNPDDTYDEYMWVEKDGTYGWEPIGSTAITIEMDDAMSNTSENPVQNKVIKGYVDGSLADKLSDDTTFWGQTVANGVVSGTIDFGDGATIETYAAGGTDIDLLLSRTDGTYTSAIDVGSRSIHIGTQDTSGISFSTASGGTISAGGAKIIGVGNPTSSGDAATKGYVDTAVAGAGGSDIVEINYSDYNPTWASGTSLTVNFGQWLRSKGVHPGQAVRIVNNGTPGHNSMYFYKGGTNEERTLAAYSLPYVVFYIVADCTSENGMYTKFSIVSDLAGDGLVEWGWFLNNDSGTISFQGEKKFLTTGQISELGQSASSDTVLSGKSGAELNTLLQIATNITGLSKVNVQSPLASKEVLTFDQTMNEWDFEWRYTMQLDSSSTYNLATASEGSQVYIYCRDTKGLPLVYTPEYTFENYELTDNSGNTVSVPMTRYSWDGTTNTGQPVVFSAQNLYLFKKFSDGWKCIGSANTPTFLPRTISA